ncbi:reverse transcriptase domain-containing protein [Tanacetum coccineum]
MAEDNSEQIKASGPHDTLAEGKSREKQEAPKAKAPENLGTEADLWKLYTDGASNEHRSRADLILIDPKGAEYSYALRLNFANSNNDAEYEALLAGLRIAAKIKVEKMYAFVDLKLVASQVEGSYEAKGVRIEELNERSVDTAKVNAIDEEATRTWMTPIKEYIEHGIRPEDVAEARTIQEKARNYTIEEGVLYRKSYLGPLLLCIGPQQAKYRIKEIHMGSCGMHDGPIKAVHKAMNAGMALPKMGNGHYWASSRGSGQIKYLIVAVDYFTKWIEAKAVTSITGRQVKNFAFDNIEGGACAEELPNVLWAHNTIPKTSNGETLFSLAYSAEAVIPAEIGIPTRRTIQRSDEENEDALRMNLNLLEERRDIAIIREARRKQQVEMYYNQRVHHKQFKVLHLSQWSSGCPTARPMEGAEIPRTWHSSNLRKYYM